MGETEVIMPLGFQYSISSTHFTAPSSPDYYFSAPPSPTKILQFYTDFDQLLISNNINNDNDDAGRNSVSLAVPFDWEEIPGKPKSTTTTTKNKYQEEYDFAFDVSQEIDIPSLSADELFHGGKIRPIKLPSPTLDTPISHTSSHANKTIDLERGRERSVSSLSSSRSRHRSTRSLSPLRVSEYPWEEEYREQQQNRKHSSKQSLPKPHLTPSVSALSSSSPKGSKKWKLRDFFLFRSASEGRATDKADPLKKYASLFKKQDDLKCSSFRSIDKPGTNYVSSSRRKGPVSAHELHYTKNRAVSEDLKKRTFLPYKQGILGRLAFNPSVHAIANGFGFSHK